MHEYAMLDSLAMPMPDLQSVMGRFEVLIKTIQKGFEQALRPVEGFRIVDGWMVADGESAITLARTINVFPPEICTSLQLAAQYGAQVAVAEMGAFMFLPQGTPDLVEQIAAISGFVATNPEEPGRQYRVFSWTRWNEPSSV